MVRVKICGITQLNDALHAVDAGAHAIGFVFHDCSPRNISIKAAACISESLPPFISKIGVFVNVFEGKIKKIVDECGLDAVQLHGDETPAFCRKFSGKVIKAFQIREKSEISKLSKYSVDAFLLDTFSDRMRGGTGKVFDWNLALAAKRVVHPIILSGGLSPRNVAEAIRKVKPFAVDVSSGVEKSPGKKDSAKLKAFLRAVVTAC